MRLFILIMIALMPLLAGSFLYYYHDRFHFKTMQHGTLVNPPIDVSYLKDKKMWRVIYVVENKCDASCRVIEHNLNQMKKALGEKSRRVHVMILEKSHLESHRIYLVDPLGNLFMFYPDTIDPMNILSDLKRVLEVSQIG